jgi:hypothetical protein
MSEHDSPAHRLLEEAADLVRYAAVAARSRADDIQADRLDRSAGDLDHEADYTLNRTRGLPMVRGRTDAPRDATIGWFLRYDAAVQAERERLGLDHDLDRDVAA